MNCKCPHYDEFFGTCNMYVTQSTNYDHDDTEWVESRCRDIELCEFKQKNKVK